MQLSRRNWKLELPTRLLFFDFTQFPDTLHTTELVLASQA